MRVVFIGADRSMGFRYGLPYDLTVSESGGRPTIDHPVRCPYGSWDAFWRNWREVSEQREQQGEQGGDHGRDPLRVG